VNRPTAGHEPGCCPSCGARGVGRVAAGQYYCRECFIEFGTTDGGWQLFHIGDEGDLVFWKEVTRADPQPSPG